MNRKITVVALCALLVALSVPAAAQQPGKAARIGYLDSSTVAGSAELLDEFRKQLTQLNWIEGKNLTIAYRYAQGKGSTRLAELAAELVSLKVDVIVVSASSAALAAKKATSSIPIVMASSVDPVAQGLIVSGAAGREHHRARRLLRRLSWKKTRNPKGGAS
jgi:putative tryptophan/tyrosine transport system substrate-binding protein